MQPTPFLSIIVPVYNVESYLAECLNSILAQSFTDFEVLLIDDGSTDGSSALCDEYAGMDSRIRCFHKENGGHMSARQEGFRNARGTYTAFVDSDDWIAPAMYEQMCGAAIKYDADVVCCNYTAVTSKEHIERRDVCSPGFYDRSGLEEKIFPTMLFSGDFFHFGVSPSLCNKLFRASLFEKHLFRVPLSLKLGGRAGRLSLPAGSFLRLFSGRVLLLLQKQRRLPHPHHGSWTACGKPAALRYL